MAKAPTNYVVDANVYITAANDYYAFDLVEGFWKCLRQHKKIGRVCSIDRVKSELTAKPDALSEWVKRCPAEVFVSTSRPDVDMAYRKIIAWVQGQNYKPPVLAKFASSTDGWLIAYAMCGGQTVVTLETTERSNKKVKIPIVCDTFNVPCVNTFAMLRDLRSRIWD